MLLAGTWHSLVIFFLAFYILATPDYEGVPADIWSIGTAVFTALILVCNYKVRAAQPPWKQGGLELVVMSLLPMRMLCDLAPATSAADHICRCIARLLAVVQFRMLHSMSWCVPKLSAVRRICLSLHARTFSACACLAKRWPSVCRRALSRR